MDIIIVKRGSAGDVLRTTSILRALKDAYPASSIYWLVDEVNTAVLDNNPYLKRLFPSERKLPEGIGSKKFDLAINLDNDTVSSSFTSMLKARDKKGFGLDAEGEVVPLDGNALRWHEMALSDELKKSNTRTYHDIIHEIAGLPGNLNRPVLALRREALERASEFYEKKGLSGEKVVAVNLGGGGRWENKSPSARKWILIIKDMLENTGAKCLVLGGRKEEDKYSSVTGFFGDRVAGAGTRNSFAELAAIIGLSDAVVTGDTLALHAANALDKHTVVLFGPTSAPEIELYGRGTKILPEMDCLCCYREKCGRRPNCMDLLPESTITGAVKDALDENHGNTSDI
ncbi:MAG: hypothetical protein GF408_05630 [Candidatus Omnitrophica bacterium]|nr:hypothetical protein [Candidatus Omnitrophota bacterium]